MADQLSLYNDALRICREARLSALTEARKARYDLDDIWNNGAVDYCLEQGQWGFAMRRTRIDYDPDLAAEFGYQYVFDKPDDWILTSALCSDERFNTPLTGYWDDIVYWSADITPIYVAYVSNSADYGNNLAAWPESFSQFVSTYLASQLVLGLTADKQLQNRILEPRKGLLDQALMVARSRAAMAQPTRFLATGTWVKSRLGRTSGRFDRGNTGSLIG